MTLCKILLCWVQSRARAVSSQSVVTCVKIIPVSSILDEVMEREGKLSDNEERADQLQWAGTEHFNQFKRKKFWENMKMKIIIGVIIAVIIIIIIVMATS